MESSVAMEAVAPVVLEEDRGWAIEEGLLIDAQEKPYSEVTREHFGMTDVALTPAVAELVRNAVHSRKGIRFRHVWNEVLERCKFPSEHFRGGHYFEVCLSSGGGEVPTRLKARITGHGRWANHKGHLAALTLMLPEEF